MRHLSKSLLALLLVVLVGFSAAGCKQQQAAQHGAEKEELVIAVDTHYAGPMFDGGAATGTNIYEPLLFLNERLEIKPGLVTSWERLDPLTWRFHLHKGVKFHNGKEFKAEAAVFAFTRILDQPKGWLKGRVSTVVDHNSFRLINDYTLEIKTLKPFPFLPYLMTHPYMVVAEPEAAEKEEIVGTGPFKFKENVQDQHVVVERNEEYWGGKSQVKRIVFKTIPDSNTRLMALQKGEIDVDLDPPTASVAEINREGRFNVVISPRVSTVDILFNRTRHPLNDIRVRKALCMAVNKEEILSKVMAGIGSRAKSVIPPEVLYSAENEIKGLPYNPTEARSLLEEAGYKDTNGDGYLDKNGQNLELKLAYYAPEPGFKEIAEAVQSYYAKVGVKSQIISWERATYFDEFGKGNWDACVDFRRLFWGAPSTQLYDDFYSKSGLPGIWYQGVSSEVDKLIEEGMELEAAKKFKEAAQKYIAVQRIAVEEQAVLCPIAYQKTVIACKNNVQNISPHPLMPFYNGATTRALAQVEWK